MKKSKDVFAAALLAACSAVKPLGIRALRGQYLAHGEDRYGRACMIDRSERINFDRSKYIPGNGAAHRLGKAPA